MEENKKKASDKNINPVEKAILLQLIEDDSKKLKSNLEKQNKFANKLKFDPEKYTSDLLNSIKEAIKKGRKDKDNNNTKNNNSETNNPDNSNSEDNESGSDEVPPTTPNNNGDKKEDKSSDWFQENKQIILISTIASLIIFLLYSQKAKKPNYSYDY